VLGSTIHKAVGVLLILAPASKLQTVGAEGWESAKTSFEKASRELAEAWHKIHPEDK
jgi:hypothetical protein